MKTYYMLQPQFEYYADVILHLSHKLVLDLMSVIQKKKKTGKQPIEYIITQKNKIIILLVPLELRHK